MISAIVRWSSTIDRLRLAQAINRLYFESDSKDDLIENDIILVWGDERRVITGADILGRLLRGVLRRRPNA